MAKRKSRHQTALLAKLLWLDVLVVGAMSLLSIGLSARYSVKLLEDGLVQNLGNVAKMLATSEQVRDALEKGLVSPGLDRYLRDVIADQNNVDVITLADMKAIRIFHPEPDRIGETFYGGDEGPVLKGEIYSSKARGTLGYQMRYFYPVYGNDGRQIGFVHVSMLMSNLTKLRDNVLIVQLQTLAVVLVLGAVAAALISMSIKRSLLGFEPGQIADIFLRRGEILDSLAEGLLAVDEAGKIILINDAAQAMLGLEKEAAQERDVDNFFPQLRIKEAITQPQSPAESASEDSCFRRLSVAINDKHILCDRVPIMAESSVIGAVAILRDRSEVSRLAEQLTGVNHVLDALRANTHEYMNQLHIILGLIRGGDLVEAERFITSVGDFQNAAVSVVLKSLRNQVVSALILGKINRCHELGIKLRLGPQTVLPRHSRFLTTKALVTVVGNLVDNAIDAINEKGGPEEGSITLLIHEDDHSLMISLDDTGVGLTTDEIAKMARGGWSTKGEHRGLGLSLIRGVAESFGGEISIDSEKGMGTSISLVFTRPRPGRPNAELPPDLAELAASFGPGEPSQVAKEPVQDPAEPEPPREA